MFPEKSDARIRRFSRFCLILLFYSNLIFAYGYKDDEDEDWTFGNPLPGSRCLVYCRLGCNRKGGGLKCDILRGYAPCLCDVTKGDAAGAVNFVVGWLVIVGLILGIFLLVCCCCVCLSEESAGQVGRVFDNTTHPAAKDGKISYIKGPVTAEMRDHKDESSTFIMQL